MKKTFNLGHDLAGKSFPSDGHDQIKNLGRTNARFSFWRQFDAIDGWFKRHPRISGIGYGLGIVIMLGLVVLHMQLFP